MYSFNKFSLLEATFYSPRCQRGSHTVATQCPGTASTSPAWTLSSRCPGCGWEWAAGPPSCPESSEGPVTGHLRLPQACPEPSSHGLLSVRVNHPCPPAVGATGAWLLGLGWICHRSIPGCSDAPDDFSLCPRLWTLVSRQAHFPVCSPSFGTVVLCLATVVSSPSFCPLGVCLFLFLTTLLSLGEKQRSAQCLYPPHPTWIAVFRVHCLKFISLNRSF